jgi:hypothetical protein
MAQQISVLGIDMAKLVFRIVGLDDTGHVVLRKRVARSGTSGREWALRRHLRYRLVRNGSIPAPSGASDGRNRQGTTLLTMSIDRLWRFTGTMTSALSFRAAGPTTARPIPVRMNNSSGWRSGGRWGIAPCGAESIATSCAFLRCTRPDSGAGRAWCTGRWPTNARHHESCMGPMPLCTKPVAVRGW